MLKERSWRMKNEVDRTNFDEKPIVLCEAAGKLNGKMKTIETRSDFWEVRQIQEEF